MGSEAEAKVGTPFINTQKEYILITAHEYLGFKKAPTQMIKENFTASGFANETINQKKTKSMEIRF